MSQTADIIAAWNSSNAILSRFNKDGYFMTRKVAAPANSDLATSEMALWWKDTVGAVGLQIKGLYRI